jgi:hypothetical protein
MAKFKVGDKVKCIKPNEQYLWTEYGKIYTVAEYHEYDITLEEIFRVHGRNSYNEKYFELVAPAVEPVKSEEPLQVGDVIRCTKNDCYDMELGKEYTIIDVPKDGTFKCKEIQFWHSKKWDGNNACDYVIVRRANTPEQVKVSDVFLKPDYWYAKDPIKKEPEVVKTPDYKPVSMKGLDFWTSNPPTAKVEPEPTTLIGKYFPKN